jgi:pilus assembly protein Flp/PilA
VGTAKVARTIRGFLNDEAGATAIEYGLLAAMIAVAIIGTMSILGDSLFNLFDTPTSGVIANQTATLQ